MTIPSALPSNGFFVQLMPMLAERTLMLIVSKVDDQHLTLSVVPKRMKEGENTALTTPLCSFSHWVEQLDITYCFGGSWG